MTNPVPVPLTLDAKPRFLFWEVDYVLTAVCGFCIGLIVSDIVPAFFLSCFFVWLWSRARAGGGVNRAFAEIYWNLPFDVFSRVPASSRRHFVG